MFCHKCGRELKDDAVRCPFCNADTSAYLKDDDSSLREILRLSEELNEENNDSGDSANISNADSAFTENVQASEDEEEKEASANSEEQSDFQDKGSNQPEETSEEKSDFISSADNDSDFYVPKNAGKKNMFYPAGNMAETVKPAFPEITREDDQHDGAEELPESCQNPQSGDEAVAEDMEIETVDAEDEEEEAEEYVDATDEFIDNYVPINEVYEEEEPEDEEPIDRDIDYEDGFVDSNYSNYYSKKQVQNDSYYDEYEEDEEKPKKPIKKKWIVIPIVVIALGAAAWFGLSEFVVNSAANEAIAAFSEQKYDTAARIYNESVKTSSIQMWLFEGKMNGYIDDIVSDHREKLLNYDEAKKALNSVVALDDDRFSQKAKDSLANIEALEASREAYAAGQEYFNNKDYINAAKEFDKVIESDPDYSKAMTSKDSSYQKYKEDVLEKTSQCQTSDEFREAIELLNEAVKNLPDDKDIIARLDECTEGLQNAIIAEIVSSIQSLIDEGSYTDALELIEENLEKYPNNSDILALKDSCIESYISWAISQAESLVNSAKYMDAINLLDSMLEKFPDNETLTSSKEGYISEYVNAAVNQAEELVIAGNYEDALSVIEKALSDLPNNATLKNKKQEIEKEMPISLVDECPPYESTNMKLFTNGSKDSFKIQNKVYREGFTLYSSNGLFTKGNGVAKIKLDGKYSKLTFNVGKIDGGRDVDGILKIYVDGDMVKTITIDNKAGLQYFEIDLNYGSELVFELSPASGSSTPSFGFTNLTLYK